MRTMTALISKNNSWTKACFNNMLGSVRPATVQILPLYDATVLGSGKDYEGHKAETEQEKARRSQCKMQPRPRKGHIAA